MLGATGTTEVIVGGGIRSTRKDAVSQRVCSGLKVIGQQIEQPFEVRIRSWFSFIEPEMHVRLSTVRFELPREPDIGFL